MTTSAQDPVLRVQINQIDHVMEQPGRLDNSMLPMVPVLRVFGPTSRGHKCCLHIHQVYPYFFVEYTGDLKGRKVREYASKLKRSLNHAIAISFKRIPNASHQQFIRAVLLVKGIHFYGFASSYSPFLKIYVVDPAMVSRVVTLLQSGSVMGTRFNVYESHLSYIMQFLCDFALYGCGWLDLDFAMKRGRDNDEDEEMTTADLELSPHFRQSKMFLEVDAQAYHILNRHKLTARNYHHELNVPAVPLSSEPFVPSVRELWEDERKRRLARGLPAAPEVQNDPSATSRGPGGSWVAEARWWDGIIKRIEQERPQVKIDEPVGTWSKYIMSTFESIEALWEDDFRSWKPESSDEELGGADVDGDVDGGADDFEVDEQVISSQEVAKAVEQDEQQWEDLQHQNDIFDDDQQHDDEDTDINYDEGLSDDDFIQSETEERQNEEEEEEEDEDPFHVASNGITKGDVTYPQICDVSSPDPSETTKSTPPSHVSQTELMDLTDETMIPDRLTQLINKFTAVHTHPMVNVNPNPNGYVYNLNAPTTVDLLSTMDFYNVPCKVYRAPHFSDPLDASDRPWEYGGYRFHIKGRGIKNLEQWQTPFSDSLIIGEDDDMSVTGGWEYASHPPSVRTVKAWLLSTESKQDVPTIKQSSQIDGPTQAFDLKKTQAPESKARERNDMTILCLEVFAPSQDEKLANPDDDELVAVFYSFQFSEEFPRREGIIAVDSGNFDPLRVRDCQMETVRDEIELLNTVIDKVLEFDPDILVGWDVQTTSWSYLAARAEVHSLDLAELISRAAVAHKKGSIQWDMRKTSTFKVAGRQVLNAWRLMRSELSLNMYTFENVVFHVLRIRIPKYSAATLSEWYFSEIPVRLSNLFRYFSQRTSMVLDVLNSSDIVTKTAEFARVFGVDFFSVISRGSQFKVESFMFRIAKPESFVLISPSKADVGKQNAAECMPLIMEPQSAFYTSPVVVLDFQSLYPSIMIAYNYCYSTCLGRVVDFQGRNKFGVTALDIPPGLLERLKDHINVAANGIMYVKHDVRNGLLGRMLSEILETRVMVKQAMKGVKDDKALLKILDARQKGLKYIANVTYGYTSASFSGRMPAVEIADSIVQSGRETLEKTIALIESTPKWRAKVVYGDTDSVFIHLHGRTKEQAFRIGQDIADTITALNPAPIKLKFEKVYLPCVLMAKKRYVGYKYENIDDTEPAFDAKGIETVRRDGVPAQSKMVEICLKLLFRTQDLSLVKAYCYRSWSKLLENKASVEDFIFAKEVRMGTYSEKGAPPPGAIIAAKRMVLDPYDEPQWGERVPYVIARGLNGSRLVDRVLTPHELIDDPHVTLDPEYYILRVLIPPLARIFNLLGANVQQWYDEMPKLKLVEALSSPSKRKKASRVVEFQLVNIDEHFMGAKCLVCGAHAPEGICYDCRLDNMSAFAGVLEKTHKLEQRFVDTQRVCMSCAQVPADDVACISLECSWMFARRKAENNLERLNVMTEFLDELDLDAEEAAGRYIDFETSDEQHEM